MYLPSNFEKFEEIEADRKEKKRGTLDFLKKVAIALNGKLETMDRTLDVYENILEEMALLLMVLMKMKRKIPTSF